MANGNDFKENNLDSFCIDSRNTFLVRFIAFVGSFVDRRLTCYNFLHPSENVGPVLKDGERHVLPCAIADQIYIILLVEQHSQARFGGFRTVALFREQ